MTFQITITALTIGVIVWILFPLLRANKAELAQSGHFDSAVYRDQLLELDRDAERGLIEKKQAESARNEIARRLLNATEAEDKADKIKASGGKGAIIFAGSGALVMALLAGSLYYKLGSPDMPDLPQAKRMAEAVTNKDQPALIAQVQRLLKKNPKDIRGWKALAPILKNERRYQEAAYAYSQILQLEKPTAPVLVNFAESLILANNGIPTKQSVTVLETAIKLENKNAQARFYLAVVHQQLGNKEKALEQYNKLLEQNPKNIQIKMAVQRQIIVLEKEKGKLPAVDSEQKKSVEQMTAKEQADFVKAMVKRLEDKLKENGNDLDGWLKLIRAHAVMGNKEKAVAAISSAKQIFKDNAKAIGQLDEMATRMKLAN